MRMPASREFREIYERSGINTPFEDYVRRLALVTALVFASTAAASTAVHSLLLRVPGPRLIPAVFSLSLAASGLAAFALLYYPLHRRNQMRAKIDDSLVYSLGYMTVLSAGGVSIERIMERVSEVEERSPLKLLAAKFMMDLKLFGFDMTSALRDISRRSPSEALRKLLDSVNNTVQTSGDLKTLLTYEVERQLQMKREKLRKMMGTLTYMGELYVTLMVVAPVLFILMLTILSVLGGALGSSVLQLNLLVFFGIPLMAAGFIIVLDTVLGGEE